MTFRFVEKTLPELADQFRQDFIGTTGTGTSILRRSVERALARAVPAMTYGVYQAINKVARQLVPSEDMDLEFLLRWAVAFLEVPQKSASFASGPVVFRGPEGTVIPAGHEVTNENGATLVVDGTATVDSSGTVTAIVTATETGPAANTSAGLSVFLSQPIEGLESKGTVGEGGIGGGADEEDNLGILSRLFQRWRTPPRGGADGDWEYWARLAPGVAEAHEFPQDPSTGYMTIVVLEPQGAVASQTTIDAALASVDKFRPKQMGGVVVRAHDSLPLIILWDNLVPNTPRMRHDVGVQVDAWLRANQVPGGTILQSDLERAGRATPGLVSISLTWPKTDFSAGQYAKFDTFSHLFNLGILL